MGVTFSRLSPPGRGAIAVAEVRGDGAAQLIAATFRTTGGTAAQGPETGRAAYGRFVDAGGEFIDDGLVLPVPGKPGEPGAYFVTVHGNPVLLERLLVTFAAHGATEVPGTVSRWLGAPGNGITREALDLLPRAVSAEGAAFLLEQGRESTGLAAWVSGLRESERRADPDELGAILGRAPRGRGLLEPRTVVLAGVPNAGKSTLFNRLLGQERVVAHAVPGTTRDLIEEPVQFGAYPIRLRDGAGLREARDEVEQEGVRRMQRAVADADLVIHLIPPADVVSCADPDTPSAKCGLTLQILSRADQIRAPSSEGVLRVSGATGQGVPELVDAALRLLFGDSAPPRGAPTPFLERHEEILREALRAAEAGADPGPVLFGL